MWKYADNQDVGSEAACRFRFRSSQVLAFAGSRFARFASAFATFALLRFRGFCCMAFLYCSKSTSLLSRKKASATRATRAMPPRYQPSDWMPKFMTRADAMVGANAPPVMAARL